MKMTKGQENAVLHRGSTLLVSAGAGSGKTSTLARRIIGRISDPDDKAEINDFLIVTFTNASAHDLAEKIERAVSECVAADMSNAKAFRQLAKIKYANISTISSFCLGVVKKHFQLLGLPAKLRVCDEAEAALLKKRIITELIEEKYASEPENSVFFDLVELFSGSKSDDRFAELIDKLHKKIYSYPDPSGWMTDAVSEYDKIIDSSDYLETEYGKIGLEQTVDAAKELRDALISANLRMSDIPEMQSYVNSFLQDICALDSIISAESAVSYKDAASLINGFSKTKLGPAKYDEKFRKDMQAARETPYKKFDSLRKSFFGATEEKIRLAADDCKKVLKALLDMVVRVDAEYTAEKNSRGVLDFSDAERYTYKLFVKEYDPSKDVLTPSDIALKYRDTFAEIYIDEYQDINPIQDMIFRSISSYDEDGHETNRFMVGDIKQSIYRFRGARPHLFAGYLERFATYDNEDARLEKKEFLSDNFRCSESVVNFTNLVFSHIMNDAYKKEDRLVYSRNDKVKITSPCEVCIFDDDETEADYYDAEIMATARKILSFVNDENCVTSDGKRITFGDIAVLLPSPKKVADRYAKYFESCGIPTYSEITENFFSNAEILLCMCLLNTIDNTHRDIYVTGAMRSEIFGFTDDDLLVIRRFYPAIAEKTLSIWHSVKAISESDIDNEPLKEKCKRFVETIERFKKYAIGTPSDKFILKLYSELHLMNVVSEKSFNRYTDSASLRRENLMILYNLARNFESSSFRGLSAFLEFLADRADKPDSIRSAGASDESSAVRIMSIHHSKGLEFPVCIICGISKQFNKSDEREKLIISDDMGIAFKLRDLESFSSSDSASTMVSYDTPFRCALKAIESRHLLEEQKRVLYVAMTRARDRLVLMLKKAEERKLFDYYTNSLSENKAYIRRATGFFDWIYSVICGYEKAEKLFSDADCDRVEILTDSDNCFEITFADTQSAFRSSADSDSTCDEDKVSELCEQIQSRLSYKYPYRPLCKVRSKISVTDIKNGKLSYDESVFDPEKADLDIPQFLKTPSYTAADAGTAMHAFMQYADFPNCEKNIADEAKRLVEAGYITGEQFEMLNYKKLSEFFESSLYAELKAAKRVWREAAFTLNLPVSELYEAQDAVFDGEMTLVQGKIDCFYQKTSGEFVVVDFKTDRVTAVTELVDRYSLQLYYYKKAVCEMTGTDDVSAFIYSFHTGECLRVE